MQIKLQKVLRPLNLAEYAPEYGEAAMVVWVNPPTSLYEQIDNSLRDSDRILGELRNLAGAETRDSARMNALRAELESTGEKMTAWLSEIWSQGQPETHMSIDDVKALEADTRENDPALFRWLIGQSWLLILGHRAGVKKN
ncbi:MAG: hypothetical protein KG029_13775 [Bacteroidetes bacterium]|nr:hypothetical protein [Bacteroidota bacterium]